MACDHVVWFGYFGLAARSSERVFRRLTFDKLGNGLREGLDTAGQVPGVLLDMLPQPLGAVHPGLHFLVELWPTPRRKREGGRERTE